jgi:hypothetical protein
MEDKNKEKALDDGYQCQHCGTWVGFFEGHDCYMRHLHERMQAKKHRKHKSHDHNTTTH